MDDEPDTKRNSDGIDPMVWFKVGGVVLAFVVVVEIVKAIVAYVERLGGWVSAHAGGIFLTLLVIGGLGTAAWLLLSPNSPLNKWWERLRQEEEDEILLSLPPPRQQKALPQKQKALPLPKREEIEDAEIIEVKPDKRRKGKQ